MTTPQNNRLDRYVAAGGETVYNYTFQLFDEADIEIDLLRADVVTTLVLNTDYTVQSVGVFNGGTITLVNPAVAGDVYAIYGIHEYRAADYTQAGAFRAADVNIDMNRQMQCTQQNSRDISYAIKLPLTEAMVNLELPSLADRAGMLLGFDSAGDLVVTEPDITTGFTDAKFIIQQPDAEVTNGQALSALGTGLLKNTTVTGVLSIAAQGTDYYAPGGTDVAVADGGTGASSAAAALTNLGALPLAGGTMTGALILNADPVNPLGSATKQYVDAAGVGTFLTVANNLSDVANAATARGNLGLGTAATQASGVFCQVANNLSDVTAATARTNLGLVIGTNVQAWDATLDAFAAYNTNGILTQTAADTFTGRTFAGTASRLSVTNGDGVAGNPTFDIDAAYVGQASITTLGTITTGVWNGTDIAIADGGTGSGTAAGALTNLGALPLAGGTMTGNLILNADPTNVLGAVTKQYADGIAAGLTFKEACFAATTGALTATYANGVAGVGATLTNSGALAAFAVDGVSPAITSRILVKNQASTFQNGVYTLTTVGSGAVAWVLTRATDYDQIAEISPGDFILIGSGTTNASTAWIQTATVATMGTDAILFTQFGGAGSVSITAGSANIVCTPSPITGAGTVNLASSPSVSGSVTVGTSLNLPTTSSSTVGVLRINSSPFLHSGNALSNNNTFLGISAGNFTLTHILATQNTCIGNSSGTSITTGGSNTLIGYNNGSSITTGGTNVLIGGQNGTAYTSSESSNILIGGFGPAGTIGESNVLRIGNGTGTSSGNLNTAIICGITGKTSAAGIAVLINASNVLGTTTSSKRFKTNIEDMGESSNPIMKLRPVTFLYDKDMVDDATDEVKFGLIAEEVLEVMPELAYINANGEPESVRYNDMPAILLNELQKLTKRVEALEKERAA